MLPCLRSPVYRLALLAALLLQFSALSFAVSPAAAAPLSHGEGLPGAPVDALTAPEGPFVVSGPQKIIVLRTRFSDYPTTTRYTQVQVQGFFDTEINNLWGQISYSTISTNATVSTLLDLPHPRSNYITDHADGDLSEGSQFGNVLLDAIGAANTAGVSFTGAKDVMVVMGETDGAQYHRGQATTCMLPIGSGGALVSVGCAIFSENPADPDARVWGRWMHEMGHAFQAAGGPAHPSNYNNSFELMDRLYPGHSGMFSKQASGAGGFPGWADPGGYELVDLGNPGATVPLYAEEYQPVEIAPGGKRAIKLVVTPAVYYMITVRGRINGDDIRPIPDIQGVLIERVVPGADPWVTVIGPGGDISKLWQNDQTYTNATDGIVISVGAVLSPQIAYQVTVRRGQNVPQPDVMIRRWLAPPLNTWETTDIWVDSSCNGYGSFMYGTFTPSGDGSPLGYGNGDSPCANHPNRVYARIRNIGNAPAPNVVVHFEVTDPLGVGMNGSTWVAIGTVTSADPQGAGLASLADGAYTDVWIPWTPSIALTPAQIAAGLFNYHSCIRVRIDTVPGETILSNQDGIDEQENIGQFFAAPGGGSSPGGQIDYEVPLRNDDALKPKTFNLDWENDLPAGWKLDVNKGQSTVDIAAGGLALLPVQIVRAVPAVAGEVYSVTIRATYLRLLAPAPPVIDPITKLPDQHTEYKPLSAATLGVIVADPTRITFKPQRDPNGGVCVPGMVSPAPALLVTGQGTGLWVDILGAKHEIMGGKLAMMDRFGAFQVCWASTEIPGLANARFATAIYQGQADLASRTGPRQPGKPLQAAPGTFQQGAYAEGLIATHWTYLPKISR